MDDGRTNYSRTNYSVGSSSRLGTVANCRATKQFRRTGFRQHLGNNVSDGLFLDAAGNQQCGE
jgi:hypothetical protein